jgi:hypothetical protein
MILFLMIWSLSSLAFFALASSMSKHQKQIFGRELDESKTRLASISGWGLLILALVICISQGTLSNMISYWLGVLTFSALFVGLCLSYFESRIKKIATATAMIWIISTFTYLI